MQVWGPWLFCQKSKPTSKRHAFEPSTATENNRKHAFCNVILAVDCHTNVLVGVLYRKNRQRCENWGNLTPVAPKPYIVQKVNQSWESPWSLNYKWNAQYLSAVCSVGCRLVWVKCLFDPFQFWDFFGGKWPPNGNFSKINSDTFRGYTDSLEMAKFAKLPKGRLVLLPNTFGSAGLVRAAILPRMGRSRPQFSERFRPLTCAYIPNFVRIRCGLPKLFPTDLFFWPQNWLQ